MSKWQVQALMEVTYLVEADDAEEAQEKVESGEFEEEATLGMNQVMSVEEVGNEFGKRSKKSV